MRSVPVLKVDPRAVRLFFHADDRFQVDLADGRSIIVPIGWSERLARATPSERLAFEITAGGELIHWESLDEDIAVVALLAKDKVLMWPRGEPGRSHAGPGTASPALRRPRR